MATLIAGGTAAEEAFALDAGHVDLLTQLVGRDALVERGLL